MKLKELSFSRFGSRLLAVVARFPLTVLISVLGTISAIAMSHAHEPLIYLQFLITVSIGAPLSVALVLFVEGMGWRKEWSWFGSLWIMLFMSVYYGFVPEPQMQSAFVFFSRHLVWVTGSILAVTFVLFVREFGSRAVSRFWEYCRQVIFTTFLTWFWAVAIQAGIVFALFVTTQLFDLSIRANRFLEIWILILGLFCTTFFLSRLPNVTDALEEALYPKEVKLFSQFVLVPLVAVYFLILYVYTAKILFLGEWPQGQLAYIILGFSALGLMTYIALYPLREQVRWIKNAGTALCIVMIPQALMLFWSLWFRVSEYGITENRYMVFVYGLWLLGVCVYLIVSKTKDIRIIPVSIVIILFVGSVGPWSAFSVSERSQVHRLETILEAYELLKDGHYTQPVESISIEDEIQANEIIRYLIDNHGLDKIEGWFDGEDFDVISENRNLESEIIVNKFGLTVRYPIRENSWEIENKHFEVFIDPGISSIIEVGDYQYMTDILLNPEGNDFELGNETYTLEFANDYQSLNFVKGESYIASIDLTSVIAIGDRNEISRDEAVIRIENDQVKLLLSIEDFFGEHIGEEVNIDLLQGLLLFTLK